MMMMKLSSPLFSSLLFLASLLTNFQMGVQHPESESLVSFSQINFQLESKGYANGFTFAPQTTGARIRRRRENRLK